MAEKTIPQLPPAASINENTLFPIDTGTQTFKATADVVANYISGKAEAISRTNFNKLLVSNWREVQDFANIGTDFPDSISSIAFCPTTGHCIAVSANQDSSDRSILWATAGLKNWGMSGALVSGVAKAWRRVIWVEGLSRFYLVGSEKISGDGCVGYTPQNNPAAGTLLTSALGTEPIYDICHSPSLSRLLAVAPAVSGTAAMISNDGTSWTSVSTPSGLGFGSCAWSPTLEKFVIGGFGQMAWSDDGLTWDDVAIPELSGTMIQKIIWVGGSINLFVATGADATVLTSPDGENWTTQYSEPSTSIFITDLAFSDALGLIVGVSLPVSTAQAGRIYFSENGIDWDYAQTLANPASNAFQAIAWVENQKMFLIGGANLAQHYIAKSLSHPGF